MIRSPGKNMSFRNSDPNIAMSAESSISKDLWINQRQKKKRFDIDADSDSEHGNEPRRQKTSCCNNDAINDSLITFGKQMEAMNKLLNSMKKEQDSRFSLIHNDMSEIKNQMNDIKKANGEFEKEIDYLGRKYGEMENERKKMSENNKKQENRVKEVMNKNVYLEKCNKALEERIMILENKELDMQIELMNVEKQEGENLMSIISKLAHELCLKSDNIEKAWRIPGEGKNPRPIVVSLRSRDARADWIKCRKAAITNNTIFNNGNNSRIFINEHLTRQTRQLFWTAKNRLKDVHKYIWIKDGRVLTKKSENEKMVYHIKFESDIDSLIEASEVK